MMLGAAYDATGGKRFLKLQRKAFDWFLGANDLNIPLYDFRTKGCNDGLMRDGVNANQGAESTLSYFLSLLAMLASYAQVEKTRSESANPMLQVDLTEQTDKKKEPIREIPARTSPRNKQVEKLT